MRIPKYNIGQQYKTIGKNSRICTITDIHTTYNLNGEMVKFRYVSQHEFASQLLTDYDVVETTISRGLITN
jgi:hypothetical protein